MSKKTIIKPVENGGFWGPLNVQLWVKNNIVYGVLNGISQKVRIWEFQFTLKGGGVIAITSDSPQGPPHGEPKVEKGCPKGQSPQNIHFSTKNYILAKKSHFAIFCSKTAFWAPKAPTPYKRNGFLALFGAIWPRKLKISKFMYFNDFWDLLRYFAFLGPKVEKKREVEFRDQKNPHEPLCFACFLSPYMIWTVWWSLPPSPSAPGRRKKKITFLLKSHFAISCSRTAFWAPKAPTPYKRNGFLALLV